MKAVRIWFQKRGAARYISHLDLNRCMTRAVRRAKIPLWYTEGFRPHAFLTFALPLPLGVAGMRESMDLKLAEDMDRRELADRLNAVLPDDLPVLGATEPVMKPGKIAWASYDMEIRPGGEPPERVAGRIAGLLERPDLPVEKRTKKGTATLNLHPYLDKTTVEVCGGAVCLRAVLPAGSEWNINPLLLTEAVCKYLERDFHIQVARTNLYDARMQEFA